MERLVEDADLCDWVKSNRGAFVVCELFEVDDQVSGRLVDALEPAKDLICEDSELKGHSALFKKLNQHRNK